MVLEDENGSEYEAKYIYSRTGLSGGWRGFALDHKLDDGDAVVFELVEAERFKVVVLLSVYILLTLRDIVKPCSDQVCGIICFIEGVHHKGSQCRPN